MPKENYFGQMPKLHARLIKIDPQARTVEAIFDPEGNNPKRATLPLAWDVELYRDGAFATPEDFQKDMRLFAMLDVDAKRKWISVRVLMDEPSVDEYRGKRPTETLKSSPSTHETRLRENGLAARLADVDAVKGRAVIVVARSGSAWARTLKLKDEVQLLAAKETKPFTVTVVECWPDAARTKIKIVTEGKNLSPLEGGMDVRVLMKPPAKTSPLDALGGDTIEERSTRILSTIMCVCGIMEEQCGGKFWTLEACNAMNCPAPRLVKKELAEWMKAGMTDEQIIKKLVERDGEKVLKPHLD